MGDQLSPFGSRHTDQHCPCSAEVKGDRAHELIQFRRALTMGREREPVRIGDVVVGVLTHEVAGATPRRGQEADPEAGTTRVGGTEPL